MYIRYQSPQPNSRGAFAGIFGLANDLARRGLLTEAEYADWRAGNDWYNTAYPDPSTIDPTVYDRAINPLAAAWFKASATDLIARIPRYLEILDAHDVACVRVESCNPGRIIYDDPVQIIVVPH